MSGWTPSPEDSGGSPGDRGTGDGAEEGDNFGTWPGPRFGTGAGGTPQPHRPAQPGATPQTGFGTQGAYGSQGNYGSQSAYGSQGNYGSQNDYRTQGNSGSQGNYGSQDAYGSQGNYGSQDAYGSQGNYGTRDPYGSQGAYGSQGNYGTQDAYGTQGNYGTRDAYGTQGTSGAQGTSGTQSAYGTQGNYGTQGASGTGYGTCYGPQTGSGSPGYAQPGPGGSYPAPPRPSRARMWFGILAGIIVLAVVIAGVSAYILNRSKKWVLTTPTTVAGLNRDTNSLDQTTFSAGVARFKLNVTNLPNYGTLKSTVSAIYALGSTQVVGFAGLNGTFNAQIVLKPGNGVKVTNVNPGPHGGAAECARTSTEAICQWSTSTTIARLDIIPTSPGGTPDSITAAAALMLKIRAAVEHPAHS